MSTSWIEDLLREVREQQRAKGFDYAKDQHIGRKPDTVNLTVLQLIYLLETAPGRMIKRRNEAFLEGSDALVSRLKEVAPVESGKFQRGWRRGVISISGNTSEIKIVNSVEYAHVIEGGVFPGNKPWPRATKKVVEYEDGRLYSRKAPGGTIKKALGNPPRRVFVERLANRIGRAVASGIAGGFGS